MDGVSASRSKDSKVKRVWERVDHSDSGGCHRKWAMDQISRLREQLSYSCMTAGILMLNSSVGQCLRHLLAVFREGRGGSQDDLAS